MKGLDFMKKILCLLLCLLFFLPAVSVADECEIRCEYCYAEIDNGDEGWMRVTYVEPGTTVYLYCDNSVVPEGKYFTGEYECILNSPQIDYSGTTPCFIMPDGALVVRAKLADRKYATVDLTNKDTVETDFRLASELISCFNGVISMEFQIDLNNDGKTDVTVFCDNKNNKGIVRREAGSDLVTQDVSLSIHEHFGNDYNCMYRYCTFKVTRSSNPDPDPDPDPSPDPNPSPNPDPVEKVSLKKLKSVKLTAVSAKKLKIAWKKLTGKERKKIQKIQIQVSTDKKFTKIVKKTLLKSTKTSWTIPGLKKNTKYWVRSRAYTKSGNVINVSKWIVKNKKTKKK